MGRDALKGGLSPHHLPAPQQPLGHLGSDTFPSAWVNTALRRWAVYQLLGGTAALTPQQHRQPLGTRPRGKREG